MHRVFLSLVLLFGCLVHTTVRAAESYVELSRSVWQAPGDKIEVIELFSYGCRHCYDLEPIINPWVEQLPADVHFTRTPAMFGGLWNIYGRLFLTLQTMNVEPRVHAAVFEAVRNGQKLVASETMANFLQSEGVDKAQFINTYYSFTVQAQVNEAILKTAAYEVSGVPALVVNGKYRFDQSAGGPQGMLKLAEALIIKARSEMEAGHTVGLQ